MELEQEFQIAKEMLMFNISLEKMQAYQEVVQEVDIPEWLKPLEDKLTTKCMKYVNGLKANGELDECLLELI